MPKVGMQMLPGLKATVCIVSARKAIEGNDLQLAQKALDLATACARREKGRDAAMKQIAELRKQLDKAQDKLLAAMRKDLEAGKRFEALKRCHTYARNFAGLRIAKAAAKEIERAETDPALRSINKKAAAEAAYAEVQDAMEWQWKQTLASAPCGKAKPKRPADEDLVAAMPAPQQAAVLKMLSYILTSCPGTTAAKKAGTLDEALRANDGLIAGIKKWQTDRDARGLFLKAAFYEAAKAKTKAVATYELLVKKHPTCKYAAVAKEKLKYLR
jgi:hypothetical protein